MGDESREDPDLGPGEDAARILAHRLTRRAVLKRFCQEGHPVLAIEEDLIEMARSKLHEAVLSVLTSESPVLCEAVRAAVRAAVRRGAAERAAGYEEDQSVRDEIVSEVCLSAMDGMPGTI
jgi:hypothetical protein